MNEYKPHVDRKFCNGTEAHLYFHSCGFDCADIVKMVDALRTDDWAENRARNKMAWAEGKSPEFVAAVYAGGAALAEAHENDESGTEIDFTPSFNRWA